MVRKLLLGMALAAFTLSASAQQVRPLAGARLGKQSVKVAQNSYKVKPLPGVNADFSKTNGGKWIGALQSAKEASASKRLVRALPSASTRVGDNTFWWAYPQGSSLGAFGFDLLGTFLSQYYDPTYAVLIGQTNYNVAIQVPQNYANGVVDSVSVIFGDPATISNVKVWFSSLKTETIGGEEYITMPATAEDADYYFEVSADEIEPVEVVGDMMYVGSTDLKLPKSYTIPEGGCLVGYTLEGKSGGYPIFTTSEVDGQGYVTNETRGGCLFSFDYQGQRQWLNCYGLGLGNLTTTIHVDPTNISSAIMGVSDLGESTTMAGEETTIAATITNNSVGTTIVNNVSYVLTVNGTPSTEQTYTLPQALPGGYYTYLPIAYTFTDEGVNNVSVEVTKVNGEPNTSTSNVGSGTFIALSEAAERTSVIEQHTGTWCGWCPRGHVGMKLFKDMYGGSVITLAGHIGDPMACSDYYDMISYYNPKGSAPTAFYDRYLSGDPYLSSDAQAYSFSAYEDLELERAANPSEASLTLEASWADDSKNEIAANVNYTFNYDRTTAPYAISFILSEDGMAGPDEYKTAEDSLWLQLNYYSGDKNWGTDDNMFPWVSAGDSVQTTYDNVIVAAWDALVGAEGSVMAPITKGETLPYNVTLDISRNTLIQNKDNLSLTALLINQNSGAIVNAAQVPLGPGSSVVGIEDVNAAGSNAAEVARYNVNGVQLSAPQKGLNIVKYSDGTTKKVVVK